MTFQDVFGGAGPESVVVQEGAIDTPIVIADDYLATSTRTFTWDVPVPAFALDVASCYFGGSKTYKGQWRVSGTISEVTAGEVAMWRLSFALTEADTAQCKPACYPWSVELHGPGEQITVYKGEVPLIYSASRLAT
ncbi:hypothetical protein [Aureliella helgolandensis]|uniref:Uncharacterized protein n=1 Tax=Aureliella helgolandensis TaxID=2527968 RepID=A0A518G2U2_9BACT|nr:hypothetical protein [Aureliella helgolandensis]QDV22914.1 hypothetical protein Q31a_12070 [Aureliella helgolandensis]